MQSVNTRLLMNKCQTSRTAGYPSTHIDSGLQPVPVAVTCKRYHLKIEDALFPL